MKEKRVFASSDHSIFNIKLRIGLTYLLLESLGVLASCQIAAIVVEKCVCLLSILRLKESVVLFY